MKRKTIIIIAAIIILIVLLAAFAGSWSEHSVTPKPSVATTSPRSATSTSTAYGPIVGSWQSIDDAKDSISFTADGRWVETYNTNESIMSGTWTVSKGHDGTLSLHEIQTDTEGAYEYTIEDIDAHSLWLTYIPRGNSLHYKKI